MPAFLKSLLAEARKFTTAAVGALAVILPLVLGASGAWVHYFQEAVAVLTAVGVYVVPNGSSAPAAAASSMIDLSKAP